MNPFDRAAKTAVHRTLSLMGYDAFWTPCSGGSEQKGRVHFNEPTSKDKLADVDYQPGDLRMEYFEGTFQGLKASVDAGRSEFVTIKDIQYFVRAVTRDVDGRLYKATLVKA